jgi:hypothetical protein
MAAASAANPPEFSVFIGEQGTKVLCLAFGALSKVGKSFTMDASSEKLTLSTLNDASSVFMLFSFLPEFFKHFKAPPLVDGKALVLCKLAVPVAQPALSSARGVEGTRLAFNSVNHSEYLYIQHSCKSGAVKTHALTYEASAGVHVTFDQEVARNRFVIACSTLSSTLELLSTSDEVKVALSQEEISFSSFHKGTKLGDATFREELTSECCDLCVFQCSHQVRCRKGQARGVSHASHL